MTSRKRDAAHMDWATIKLGCTGTLDKAEIDTHHYKGNHPSAVIIHACKSDKEDPEFDQDCFWFQVLPRSDLGPHQQHFFALDLKDQPFTHVKVCIIPDGGIKRVRIFGRPIADAPVVEEAEPVEEEEPVKEEEPAAETEPAAKAEPGAETAKPSLSLSPAAATATTTETTEPSRTPTSKQGPGRPKEKADVEMLLYTAETTTDTRIVRNRASTPGRSGAGTPKARRTRSRDDDDDFPPEPKSSRKRARNSNY